jgi:glycosyltransferase involved in cell wall biosynthesis
MEAMTCGVPVIASAIGGLKDFIVSGKNGILFPEGDFKALADEIEKLTTQKDDCLQTLVKGGWDAVQHNCFPQTVALKLAGIFCNRM